jgi:endonuclease/exonuclease/phosphatase family metal-dependent hydrolase
MDNQGHSSTRFSMRIATLNTWKCEGQYRERRVRMSDLLARLDPDVVLLQEVFVTEDGEINTAAHLATALSRICLQAPARAKPRLFEGAIRASTSGLAVLVRQPVLAHRVVHLPSEDADGERIAQLLHIEHEGRELWLANTHLTHLVHACTLRTHQAVNIMTTLRELSGNGAWLIGGDFNTGPGSRAFSVLEGEPWCLANPFAGLEKTTHIDEAGRRLDLDHVLLSGWPTSCVEHAFVTDDADDGLRAHTVSDHAAVVIDIDVSGLPPALRRQR